MPRLLLVSLVSLFIFSCVTEPIKKKSSIVIGPNDDVKPIIVQGYVMGAITDENQNIINYPLKDVRISVSKGYKGEGISISTLSDPKGFFSLSPDYIATGDKTKRKYIVSFQKRGFRKVSKVMELPSKKSFRLNVVLKGAK